MLWQDLVEECAYCGSYVSVRRYTRRIKRSRPELSDIMHASPGEEAQVDFFQGPLTPDPETGCFFRTWVFRMVLSHSRNACEEAVRRQGFLSFIRLRERALRFFGGVPSVVMLDNFRAGVARVCLFDPDINPVYSAFADGASVPSPASPASPRRRGRWKKRVTA